MEGAPEGVEEEGAAWGAADVVRGNTVAEEKEGVETVEAPSEDGSTGVVGLEEGATPGLLKLEDGQLKVTLPGVAGKAVVVVVVDAMGVVGVAGAVAGALSGGCAVVGVPPPVPGLLVGAARATRLPPVAALPTGRALACCGGVCVEEALPPPRVKISWLAALRKQAYGSPKSPTAGLYTTGRKNGWCGSLRPYAPLKAPIADTLGARPAMGGKPEAKAGGSPSPEAPGAAPVAACVASVGAVVEAPLMLMLENCAKSGEVMAGLKEGKAAVGAVGWYCAAGKRLTVLVATCTLPGSEAAWGTAASAAEERDEMGVVDTS